MPSILSRFHTVVHWSLNNLVIKTNSLPLFVESVDRCLGNLEDVAVA